MLRVVATFQIAAVLQPQYESQQHSRCIGHYARQGALKKGTFVLVQGPGLLLAGTIAVGDISTIGALEHFDAVNERLSMIELDYWLALGLAEI